MSSRSNRMRQESVDAMEQQISDDEEKNTPLARRTTSARAARPSRFVLPSAIIPDESDDEFVGRSQNMTPNGWQAKQQVLPSSPQETSPQETDADTCPWIKRPTTHSGTESTEPPTNAITQEEGDRSDEV